MKKLFLFSLGVFMAFFVNAQVIEETTPQPAQPKAPTYNSSLLLDVDVDCRVFVDGKQKEDVKAGVPLQINLNEGQRLLQLKVFDNYQLHKQIVELEKGKQFIVSLSLKSEYNDLQKQMADEQEEKFWHECSAKNDLESMQKYLELYPDGNWVADAMQAIKLLKDKNAWQNTQSENTKTAYQKYADNYPNGEFINSANQQIEQITWDETTAENTMDAFQAYIQIYPEGAFIDEANAFVEAEELKIEEADWQAASTKNDVAAYRDFLKKHHSGKYAENAGRIVALNILQETGIEMVFVKGGTFTMGCDTINDSDCYKSSFAHTVKLDGFFMGKYEVTQKQWKKVMGSLPDNIYKSYKCNECPIIDVNYNDAMEFIAKLNSKTGMKYRLPTEAEWEYAARGGASASSATATTYAGSNNISDVAWYDGNSGSQIHPVGQKKPNELGLYDMSGNVWEWCADWYGADYYSNSPANNPQGPSSGSDRVSRGGSWGNDAPYCRVANRHFYDPPDFRGNDLGFRLSRDVNF
ncbi:MAG: SUMF1/EgtB/PvdO family nonheme iron enzyme [Bacteroidales bacterium]|nr:SUMF1/EgtB/PvdO family nonheme iron enzyme [Bacteroidales bacterium]